MCPPIIHELSARRNCRDGAPAREPYPMIMCSVADAGLEEFRGTGDSRRTRLERTAAGVTLRRLVRPLGFELSLQAGQFAGPDVFVLANELFIDLSDRYDVE